VKNRNPDNPPHESVPASVALKFVLLFGLVSCFSDFTQHAARSVAGPFLAVLGASGAVVGIVGGLGELIAYCLRIVSGYVADRTGRYWTAVYLGYGMNLLAVPLLAFVDRWEAAAGLILLERFGKAFRAPARDAMLAHAAEGIGRGRGFGIHKALDQTGGLLGPLMIAGVLYAGWGYSAGFLLLIVPAVMTLGMIAAARSVFPGQPPAHAESTSSREARFPRIFWVYLVGSGLVAAGYADLALVAYHFKKAAVASDGWIPILYACAMAAEAAAGLVFGRLFDRLGLPLLLGVIAAAAFFAPLVFLGGQFGACAGLVLWGAGMGGQDSIMKAVVADLAPRGRIAFAYGVFNTGYGLFWFGGSVVMGMLYDVSLISLVFFSLVLQLVSLPLLLVAGAYRGKQRH